MTIEVLVFPNRRGLWNARAISDAFGFYVVDAMTEDEAAAHVVAGLAAFRRQATRGRIVMPIRTPAGAAREGGAFDAHTIGAVR